MWSFTLVWHLLSHGWVSEKEKKRKVWGGWEEPESYVDTECSGTFLWGVQYFKKWPSSEGWGRGNVWHLTSFVSVDIFLLMQRSTELVLIGCWITREFTPLHLSVSQLFIPRAQLQGEEELSFVFLWVFLCNVDQISFRSAHSLQVLNFIIIYALGHVRLCCRCMADSSKAVYLLSYTEVG